jgi:cytochrome c oxidase subunit II
VVGLAFVFLAVVEGLLLIIMLRFRRRAGDGEPRQRYGSTRLEFWWTAIPLAVLVVLFGFTVQAVNAQTSIHADALPVTVIGHQWWWELRYPSLGVVAANELHVPAGRQIKLTLLSADVVHNFWVPSLAGKEQLIPGQTNVWSFTAARPGVYQGACSEYCGGAHAWMLLSVVAQPAAEFDAWAAQQRRPASTAPDAAAEQLFDENACAQCHTIRGTAAAGTVGPDLTHVGSRQTLAAGRLPNTLSAMTAWIHDPQAQDMKPASLMPNLHLSPDQAAQLAGWLEELK